MKLLIQPGSGVAPLVEGIKKARSSVAIMIFRFDRREIERALIDAVARGVTVHALIAHTNRGGEKSLRALEMRLLAAGVTVARTADDLIRYHAKILIVDKRELYVLGFNFARTDIEHSRSFGVITTNGKFVREAVKLFECDMKRQPYEPGAPGFVVSPQNARQELSAFIAGAKRELLVYDPKIDDEQMIRLLKERADAGVKVRILGRITGKPSKLEVRKLAGLRLHTRTFLRDGKAMFVGSQSLRTVELDSRREVGIIASDQKSVNQLCKVFEGDWAPVAASEHAEASTESVAAKKIAKKVAKAVTKSVGPELAEMVNEASGGDAASGLDMDELRTSVKEKVAEAVNEILQAAATEEDEPSEVPAA